ncbi:hypothetical protein GW17_00026844 [Ensete ventricosum]|nr:hypothetical protein GW17_00026844 [Ensete ventricosum]
MFNLGKMKSGGGVGSGSTIPSAANAPATVDPANTSGSTARTPAEKGKGVVELEEAPEWGYTIRELCEVEDRAGSDKYFASIMMWRKCVDSEDPLVSSNRIILALWTTNKELRLDQELVIATECWVKELEDEMKKTRAELESLRNQRKELELEARVLDSSLDEVRNDRARLEGEVLSLIEASTFLEVELKGEGSKAVAAYKASRRFELGLGKIGRVSYEFGYRVALERLWGKHPEIVIE